MLEVGVEEEEVEEEEGREGGRRVLSCLHLLTSLPSNCTALVIRRASALTSTSTSSSLPPSFSCQARSRGRESWILSRHRSTSAPR